MARLRNGAVREEIEAKVRLAEREAVLPGSAAEHRAIPVVASGTPGAIPGSQPEAALLAAERRRERR
jgi:hypothetical protein